MSTSVKHIHNGMRGAPQISGTAGTLIAVLDALFVSGWGVTTALSVNVSGGIATATLTPGETFDRDAVVLVAGATPSALNGEARVVTTSNSSITWSTTAPDGAATGTITIKYAPQTSWSKVYAATNKAVYRSTHVQSSGHYLRVDDTGTTTARVRGYETMTDVDTGTGPFPTDDQMSGGGYWHKSILTNATAVKYRIFCDERFIILAVAAGSTTAANISAPARGFGDPIAQAPGGDAWATLLSVNNSATSGVGYASFVNSGLATGGGMTVMPRALSGLGGSVRCGNIPFTGKSEGASTASGADSTLGQFPSPVDGQAKPSKIFTREAATNSAPRAVVPGIFYLPQSGAYGVIVDGDTLPGSGELIGRRLLVVAEPGGGSWANAPSNCFLIDITGPWR